MSQFDLGAFGAIVGGLVSYAMINAWVPNRHHSRYIIAWFVLAFLTALAIVYHYNVGDAER